MDNKECNCNDHHDHDHECDCGCNDEEMQVINLTLDDGSEMQCGVIGVFDVEEKSYIALLSDEDEVLLYEFKEVDEESIDLIRIEDDAEFDLVAEAFEELFDEIEEE